MAAKITRALNLIIPIETEEQGKVFIHSTPISRQVFEEYFLVMSRTFAQIFTAGLGIVAGPRVAYLMLKELAGLDWDSVKKGLVNEIIRLSNVAIMGEKGWEQMPLYTAFERGILSDEDRADIEGELIFFTLVASLNKRPQILAMMESVNGLWGSEVTALTFTDYLNSLPILTVEENTGATEKAALPPH